MLYLYNKYIYVCTKILQKNTHVYMYDILKILNALKHFEMRRKLELKPRYDDCSVVEGGLSKPPREKGCPWQGQWVLVGRMTDNESVCYAFQPPRFLMSR